MATTQELLSLQRKIALDSYHHTVHNEPQRLLRPNSFSATDSNKSSKAAKSSKSNKSRSKDTSMLQTTSHLPSIAKPFKKIFKRPKHEIPDNCNQQQNTKSINIKKLIDRKLLQRYQQTIEERVEMLRSRAFPHEVIYQLPQYRAALTDSLNKSIQTPHFSRHQEIDQINQLIQAEKHALQHTTKPHKKTLTLKSLKKGIVAPIQPIKRLFVTNKMKTGENILNTVGHISCKDYAKLKGKGNYGSEGISNKSNETNKINENEDLILCGNEAAKPDSTATAEPKRERIEATPTASIPQIPHYIATQLISALTSNKMEVIKDPFADDMDGELEETPVSESILPHNTKRLQYRHSLDTAALPKDSAETGLIRSKTTASHRRSARAHSTTPPFLSARTVNVRTVTDLPSLVHDDTANLPSNTPSWALRDSTEEMADAMSTSELEPRVTVSTQDFDILRAKYDELELLCQDLQITLRTMEQNMDEQKNRIHFLTQQMHGMEDEMKRVNNKNNGKSAFADNAIQTEAVPYPLTMSSRSLRSGSNGDLKLNKNNSKYFDYGYFWDIFKEKIEEQDIISFQRSKWENIYHSLFSYFMNGLMVLFNILTQSYMLIAFILSCLLCCLCKKNTNTKNVKRRNKKRQNRMRGMNRNTERKWRNKILNPEL